MKKFLLFDLDGTISESAPGIMKSMAYGLTGEDVDNTVHIAGFVIGFLLSILLFRPERN